MPICIGAGRPLLSCSSCTQSSKLLPFWIKAPNWFSSNSHFG